MTSLLDEVASWHTLVVLILILEDSAVKGESQRVVEIYIVEPRAQLRELFDLNQNRENSYLVSIYFAAL